jgi:hypothetical protein
MRERERQRQRETETESLISSIQSLMTRIVHFCTNVFFDK